LGGREGSTVAKNVDSTAAIFGTINEAGDTVIRLDPDTRGLIVVSWEHYLIHTNYLNAVLYTDSTVAKDGNSDIVIRVAPEKSLHMHRAKFWGEGSCLFQIITDFEWDDQTGDVLSPINFNFYQPPTVLSEFRHNPDITGGDIKYSQLMPGGKSSGDGDYRVGADHEIAYEWILDPGSELLIRVVNISGAASIISGQLNVFEDLDIGD
jgi:hypothetical protein